MNPLLKYGAVILAVAALFAAHRYTVNSAAKKAYHEGSINERATWLARESHELQERNVKIIELETKYRTLERKSAADVVVAAAKAQKEVERATKSAEAAIASLERFRLRWAASYPSGEGSSGDPTPVAGAPATGTVPAPTCELPERTRRDLIELAAEADKVVIERNALLEIAQKDREVCK